MSRGGLQLGLGVGLWVGVLDGAVALSGLSRSAGGLGHRLGSVLLAMAVDAALLGLALGGALAALTWLRRRFGSAPPRRPALRLFGLNAGLALCTAVAVALLFGTGRETGVSTARDRPPNLLLISIDTLRADHTSPYGYSRDTTPTLARLAHEGTLFEEAYSHATWTLPSHASLLTGYDPVALGVVGNRDVIAEPIATLAERLADAGYWTGAWVGTPSYGYVGARYGFDAGFALYQHAPHARPFRSSWLARRVDQWLYREVDRGVGGGRAQTDAFLRFLRSGRKEPFFAFVHYYDVHSKTDELPYDSPDPDRFCEGELDSFEGCAGSLCASDRLVAISRHESPAFDPHELDVVRCLYDGGIAFVDGQLARVLDALEEEGLAERTVVVVTSDHGEAFLEHRSVLHVTLHDEVTRVPLVIRLPGGAAGRRVRGPVGLVDVAPTLLELAGVPEEPPAGAGPAYGTSLVPVLTSWREKPDQPVLAIDHDAVRMALRLGPLKLIRPATRGRSELFDLASDAEEQANRAGADPEHLARMVQALEAHRRASEAAGKALRGADEASPQLELSTKEQKALRALGYVEDSR